jgi:hypothetical protein
MRENLKANPGKRPCRENKAGFHQAELMGSPIMGEKETILQRKQGRETTLSFQVSVFQIYRYEEVIQKPGRQP